MMQQKIFKLHLNRLKCRFVLQNWNRATNRAVQYGTSSTGFKDLYLPKDTINVCHSVSVTVLLVSEIKKGKVMLHYVKIC